MLAARLTGFPKVQEDAAGSINSVTGNERGSDQAQSPTHDRNVVGAGVRLDELVSLSGPSCAASGWHDAAPELSTASCIACPLNYGHSTGTDSR